VSVRTGLLTILALLGGVAADASCLDSLAAHRAQTEADYLKSADSPFDEAMRARFAGFSYFDGDAAFCVDASFEPASKDEKQFNMTAFNGKTDGKETYGGGRYLDLYFPIGAHTELDFNHAYNPLCAYDSKFTCPMPPPENRLKPAVTAGEKAYAGKH